QRLAVITVIVESRGPGSLSLMPSASSLGGGRDPPLEHRVHGLRADDWFRADLQPGWTEHEWPGLVAAQATVGANMLLEGRHLGGIGPPGTYDKDIRGVAESAGTQQQGRCIGAVPGEGIIAFDHAVSQGMKA